MIAKKFIYIFIVIFFSSITSTFAQKTLPIILEYNNGKTVTGTIKTKSFHSSNSKFKIKTENGEKIKVKSKELKKIILKFDDQDVIFEKESYAVFFFKKRVHKKKKIWLSKFYESGNLVGYFGFSKYTQIRRGATGNQIYPVKKSLDYYVKLTGDKYIMGLAQDVPDNDPFHAFDKQMRNIFSKVVKKDCPEFKKILNKKKYRIEEVTNMFDDYIENCGK